MKRIPKIVAITLLGVCLFVAWADRSLGAIVTFTPVVDAFASDTNGDGIFDSVTDSAIHNMPVQRFSGVTEDRSIFEFDISSIPTNSVITDARFQYRAVASGGVTFDVSVEGYVGDGLITIPDATAVSTQLASYDANAFGLGPVEIILSTTFFQSQIGQANPIGLRLQAEIDGVGTAVSPSEAIVTPPVPTLVLDVSSVPEPATAAFTLIAGAFLLIGRRRRRHRQHAITAAQLSGR